MAYARRVGVKDEAIKWLLTAILMDAGITLAMIIIPYLFFNEEGSLNLVTFLEVALFSSALGISSLSCYLLKLLRRKERERAQGTKASEITPTEESS